MRDGIVTGIVALIGAGFCGLGVKVAWWLVATILKAAAEKDLVTVIATGIIGYFGGVFAVILCLAIGIGLLVIAIDN